MRELAHDNDPTVTVRVVRETSRCAPSYLVAIPNAHPWVLRRPYLVPEDVD